MSLPLRLAGLWLAALLVAAPASAQQHTVAPGETLDIAVFRVPELTRQAVVDVDGQIAFPPLGQIAVAGQTVDQIAAVIEQRLAGLEILLDAQVTVGLTTVRPIVIGGDVAQPGALPYQPGLTVRRAIALGGGLGALRPSMGAVTELRAERDAIAAELVAKHATRARAQAELDNVADLVPEDLPELAGNDRAAVLTLANSLLDAARAESESQKAFLSRDLAIIDNRIERLGEQREHQKALVEQQTEEVTRYTDMQERGLTPQTRVSEEYRTLNELRGNLAQVEADIADVRRAREAAMHELERHDARRAATLQAEVQTALTEIAALNARFRGVTSQLTQFGLGGNDPLRITVHRMVDGQEKPMAADEDTVLEPGDLVEVELPDSFYGLSQSADLASAAPVALPAAVDQRPAGGRQEASR